MEEFRELKDFRKYKISNLGRIKNIRNNTCIRVKQLAGKGYYQVRLFENGKYHYRNLHRLMAETFLSNPNNYNYVVHKDGDKKNNRLDNLMWSEKPNIPKLPKGILYKNLTTKNIITIYKMLSKDVSIKDIAELYEIPNITVYKISKGLKFKNLFIKYKDKFNLQY